MPRKRPDKNLAGAFLAAMPGLLDKNFRRTLLYLSHHEPDSGAVGLVLNRPIGTILADIVPDCTGLGTLQLHEGGPVSTEQVIVASLVWSGRKALFTPLDKNEGLPDSPMSGLRAFAGFAGWSEGQLEEGIREGSWKVLAPRRSFLAPLTDRTEGLLLWKSVMNGMGPLQRLLADAPDHPENN